MSIDDVTVTPDDFERRIIQPEDFVADTSAFVDVRIPGSEGKASYSMIGPGVSQNADQKINLAEPHGFNVGAATVPSGGTNNQHLHYTAEVFICTAGHWQVFVGQDKDQSIEVKAGDIFATPTWIFRGFSNLGGDDGWMFTVLGGDDTGGILWAPYVLDQAAETGLYLNPDYSVADVGDGELPEERVKPLSPEVLAGIDTYSDEELAQRLVKRDGLVWNGRGLLSSVIAGHDTELAPVIGFGMTQYRGHSAPVMVPHGFSVEWIRIGPGSQTGLHRHDETQALFIIEGDFEVSVNDEDAQLKSSPADNSVVSIPRNAWRNFSNSGDTDAFAVIVNNGDQRTNLEWSPTVLAEATEAGFGLDADGFVAPLALLGRAL